MNDNREAVGKQFSLPALLQARDLAMEAVRRIGAGIQTGMIEQQAEQFGQQVLKEMDTQRIWHKTLVRFGEGTLKAFQESSNPECVLGKNDIFFVDIGPVWAGHEGDAGDPTSHGRLARFMRIFWRTNEWLELTSSPASLLRSFAGHSV